ncbi:MAG: transcriptional regulator containing an amidase domain and an AraC-type DNA-binding domain [Lacrimispora sp.]|jgi:transcriptional regulator GlxA family with amidase domain|nr:transcriptional regulator containing an amidase domain and an AraC-type DNA-binding domain [Lacrimispora sp.]
MKNWNVGILLFNEVELLDFAGPFEVFSITAYPNCDKKPFTVNTVAQTKDLISVRNGLKVLPDYDFINSPCFDILLIPGGYGAEEIEIHNEILINWIRDKASECHIIASVCTGSFLLAEAGILDGKRATTHWMDISRLEREYSKVKIQRGVKFVDENTIITSGGISAGINMSFYLLIRLVGKEIAIATAKRMEYDIDILKM